jgi:hypothetical protein
MSLRETRRRASSSSPFVAAATGMRFPTGEEDVLACAVEFGGRGTEKEKLFAAQI